MKKIMVFLCIAIAAIGLLSAAQAEGAAASSVMRIYGAGKYEVGKDFIEGEYILFSAPDQQGTFIVSTDAEELDVISDGTFSWNTILTVMEGDFLDLIDCIAVFGEDYYSVYTIQLYESDGMLKVGQDIEPGAFELLGDEGKISQYRIYSDSRNRMIVDEREFQGVCYLRIDEGQYLEMTGCTLGRSLTDEEFERLYVPPATPTPEPTPAPTPTPPPVPEEGEEIPGAETEPLDETGELEWEDEPDEFDFEDEAPDENEELTGEPAGTEDEAAQPTPAPTPEPTPEPVILVRIDKAKNPTVRSLPSTKGEKIGTAKAGMEYRLLETQEKWYRIRLDDGAEGWIVSSMAEIIGEGEANDFGNDGEADF